MVDLAFRAATAASAALRWRRALEAERKLSMSTAMETWAGKKTATKRHLVLRKARPASASRKRPGRAN